MKKLILLFVTINLFTMSKSFADIDNSYNPTFNEDVDVLVHLKQGSMEYFTCNNNNINDCTEVRTLHTGDNHIVFHVLDALKRKDIPNGKDNSDKYKSYSYSIYFKLTYMSAIKVLLPVHIELHNKDFYYATDRLGTGSIKYAFVRLTQQVNVKTSASIVAQIKNLLVVTDNELRTEYFEMGSKDFGKSDPVTTYTIPISINLQNNIVPSIIKWKGEQYSTKTDMSFDKKDNTKI